MLILLAIPQNETAPVHVPEMKATEIETVEGGIAQEEKRNHGGGERRLKIVKAGRLLLLGVSVMTVKLMANLVDGRNPKMKTAKEPKQIANERKRGIKRPLRGWTRKSPLLAQSLD